MNLNCIDQNIQGTRVGGKLSEITPLCKIIFMLETCPHISI